MLLIQAQLEISAKRHLDLNLAPRKQPTDWKQSTLEVWFFYPNSLPRLLM